MSLLFTALFRSLHWFAPQRCLIGCIFNMVRILLFISFTRFDFQNQVKVRAAAGFPDAIQSFFTICPSDCSEWFRYCGCVR